MSLLRPPAPIPQPRAASRVWLRLAALCVLAVPQADPVALHDQALAQFLRGQYAQSLRTRRAVGLAPGNAHYVYDLGITLLDAGAAPEAERLFRSAAAKSPKNAKLLLGLGIACHLAGRSEEAKRHLAAAVRLEPDAADLYASLGDVYRGTGRHEKAEDAYATAVRLDPRDVSYLLKRGLCLLDLQKEDAAVVVFQKAAAANPNSAEAHYQLGNLAASERAVALDPGLAQAHCNPSPPSKSSNGHEHHCTTILAFRCGPRRFPASAPAPRPQAPTPAR